MIQILFDPKIDNKNLMITIKSTQTFHECVDFLKLKRCEWNNSKKVWLYPAIEFDDMIKSIQAMGEPVAFDMSTVESIKKFKNSLIELKSAQKRITFNQNLLNFPPFKGKSPNESFQIKDILRGLNQNRFLYNHEMGLGKSYILTAIIAHLYYLNLAKKFLVFSSPIGIMNLKDEIVKFINAKNAGIGENDIVTFTSASSLKFEDRNIFDINKYPQKIIILTYDMLKTVGKYYYDILKGTKHNPHPSNRVKFTTNVFPMKNWLNGEKGCLLLDECHQIGNRSRRTEIMDMVVDSFEYRYLFTGTFADKYEKMYEPCNILDSALVGGRTYNQWLSVYNELGNRFSRWAVNSQKWNLEKIGELNKSLLTQYGSKRLLTECMDLPPNYDVPTIYIEMDKKQREIYEIISNYTVKSQYKKAKEENKTLTDKARYIFQYIQCAIDNPRSLLKSKGFNDFPEDLKQKLMDYNYENDFEKLKVLDNILEEKIIDAGQKGIVWYYHPETMESLKKHYAKYKPYIISADVERSDMVPLVKDFIKSTESFLLIASINIMNTSVTITEAKFMCYLECTFNYANFLQSKKRNYRFGQTETTYNYFIRYNKSLDLLQERNLASKGELMDSLMNREYISQQLWKKLFNLKKDDIIED